MLLIVYEIVPVVPDAVRALIPLPLLIERVCTPTLLMDISLPVLRTVVYEPSLKVTVPVNPPIDDTPVTAPVSPLKDAT